MVCAPASWSAPAPWRFRLQPGHTGVRRPPARPIRVHLCPSVVKNSRVRQSLTKPDGPCIPRLCIPPACPCGSHLCREQGTSRSRWPATGVPIIPATFTPSIRYFWPYASTFFIHVTPCSTTPLENLNLGRDSNCTIYAIYFHFSGVGRGSDPKNSLKTIITPWLLWIIGVLKN